MNPSFRPMQKFSFTLKSVAFIAFCAIVLSLAGCGSTKVYTADKTIVHNGSIYNVSNVKVFSYDVEGILADNKTIPLKNADKKQINDLLKSNGAFTVRQTIQFDDQQVVYQQRRVDSWSDFNKMNKQFESAGTKVRKFLADKKKTQMTLT